MTDSDKEIYFDEDKKPGISNLLSIYAALDNISIDEAQRLFASSSYKEFKEAVGEKCVSVISPIQERYKEILNDKSYLESVMKQGAEKAEYLAYKMIRKVNKKIGLIQRVR